MYSSGQRTGIANLPLHYGKVPPWLFGRMCQLAREITIVAVTEFGTEEMLRRLSDPFWFQAFGCVLGYDWHSSGVTTTVCGAIKEVLTCRDFGKSWISLLSAVRRSNCKFCESTSLILYIVVIMIPVNFIAKCLFKWTKVTPNSRTALSETH